MKEINFKQPQSTILEGSGVCFNLKIFHLPLLWVLLALFSFGLLGCEKTSTTPSNILKIMRWNPAQKRQLKEFILAYGKSSSRYRKDQPPIAIFDWDNTVIKNDIGANMLHWMLDHDAVLLPPHANWSMTNPYLTSNAIRALSSKCGDQDKGGKPIHSQIYSDCIALLKKMYDKGETLNGEPAFTGFNYRHYRGSTAWQTAVLAGYTPAEIRKFAAQVIDELLKAPIRSTSRYLRFNQPMVDLIEEMKSEGFEVWVVSASPQAIVEVFAARVGINSDRVIGLRNTLDKNGRLEYKFQDCGSVQKSGGEIINYIEGKRCWINKVIFHVKGEKALKQQTEEYMRPVFVAGDATTDISMLQDATGLRLVIDRGYEELMCYALAGQGAQWLITPMFYEQKAPRKKAYPCSTTACVAADGSKTPCLNSEGSSIIDQQP